LCQRLDVDDVEDVRAWRSPSHDRALWIHGVTTHYQVKPVGEFVIGVCLGRGYHLSRARTKHTIQPGQLVVLDPSTEHSGSPAGEGPWEGRLLVIELPDLQAAAADEGTSLQDLDFPDPKVGDRRLAACFVALHRLVEGSVSVLEQQGQLYAFLQDLADLSPGGKALVRPMARDTPAIRRACDHLRADVTRNVTLDELAAVAGTSKYRLVRQFRMAFGLPPHAFQISQRIVLARRLIEHGMPLADVAGAAGFVDQSHLHRHFHPTLGMTPAQYARAIGHDRIDLSGAHEREASSDPRHDHTTRDRTTRLARSD
jgi:AraC-like DNA-binding protein